MLAGASGSDHERYAVVSEDRVTCEDAEAFAQGVCDQNTIDGIRVVAWQLGSRLQQASR